VQPNERNIFDQRWIEMKIVEKCGARLLRKTLKEMETYAELRADRTLWV
jgi:hypothetical protein